MDDKPTDITTRSAIISECSLYRYRLERGIGPAVAFIMVNPSTADAHYDDATIRKCIGFTKRLNRQRFIVGNLFAYRATDVKVLRTAPDPIGPDNDRHLEEILRGAVTTIVAWGSLLKMPVNLRDRWKHVVSIADRFNIELKCLGVNNDGHPRHPLTTTYETPLTPWVRPKK